jgi:hypothetical protein
MRWPVEILLFKVADFPDESVQASRHMESALDHIDIRGLEPHVVFWPEPASH